MSTRPLLDLRWLEDVMRTKFGFHVWMLSSSSHELGLWNMIKSKVWEIWGWWNRWLLLIPSVRPLHFFGLYTGSRLIYSSWAVARLVLCSSSVRAFKNFKIQLPELSNEDHERVQEVRGDLYGDHYSSWISSFRMSSQIFHCLCEYWPIGSRDLVRFEPDVWSGITSKYKLEDWVCSRLLMSWIMTDEQIRMDIKPPSYLRMVRRNRLVLIRLQFKGMSLSLFFLYQADCQAEWTCTYGWEWWGLWDARSAFGGVGRWKGRSYCVGDGLDE